jgi:hypothetical protein
MAEKNTAHLASVRLRNLNPIHAVSIGFIVLATKTPSRAALAAGCVWNAKTRRGWETELIG